MVGSRWYTYGKGYVKKERSVKFCKEFLCRCRLDHQEILVRVGHQCIWRLSCKDESVRPSVLSDQFPVVSTPQLATNVLTFQFFSKLGNLLFVNSVNFSDYTIRSTVWLAAPFTIVQYFVSACALYILRFIIYYKYVALLWFWLVL